MPLTINVGLSRKASKDFQSSGTSINITAELDQSLLNRPDQLQHQIDQLYQQAESALARQAAQSTPPSDNNGGNGQGGGYPNHGLPGARRTANGGNGNGRGTGQHAGGNGHAQGSDSPSATQSQMRAIHAISNRLGMDPATECGEALGLDIGRLTIREASQFIDHLKALQAFGQERR